MFCIMCKEKEITQHTRTKLCNSCFEKRKDNRRTIGICFKCNKEKHIHAKAGLMAILLSLANIYHAQKLHVFCSMHSRLYSLVLQKTFLYLTKIITGHFLINMSRE